MSEVKQKTLEDWEAIEEFSEKLLSPKIRHLSLEDSKKALQELLDTLIEVSARENFICLFGWQIEPVAIYSQDIDRTLGCFHAVRDFTLKASTFTHRFEQVNLESQQQTKPAHSVEDAVVYAMGRIVEEFGRENIPLILKEITGRKTFQIDLERAFQELSRQEAIEVISSFGFKITKQDSGFLVRTRNYHDGKLHEEWQPGFWEAIDFAFSEIINTYDTEEYIFQRIQKSSPAIAKKLEAVGVDEMVL